MMTIKVLLKAGGHTILEADAVLWDNRGKLVLLVNREPIASFRSEEVVGWIREDRPE